MCNFKAFQLPRASNNAYMKECAMQSIVQHFVHSEIRYVLYIICTTKVQKPNEKTKQKKSNTFFTQYHSRHNMRLKIIESIIYTQTSLLDSPDT